MSGKDARLDSSAEIEKENKDDGAEGITIRGIKCWKSFDRTLLTNLLI